MDALNQLFPTGLPWPEILIAFTAGAIIYSIFTYSVISNDEESAPDLSVPVPEQCKPGWQGKLLDEPNIKVSTAPVQSL